MQNSNAIAVLAVVIITAVVFLIFRKRLKTKPSQPPQQAKGEGQLEDRKIVELLISSGPLTVPKICKHFDVKNHQNAIHHLERLAEKGIVKITKKKYGSTYQVQEDKIAISRPLTWEVIFSIVFLSVGAFMLFDKLYLASAVLLLVSSVVGTVIIFMNASKYKKEKVKSLLALLD